MPVYTIFLHFKSDYTVAIVFTASMPRRLSKASKKRALYNAAAIADNFLSYRRTLLDLFATQPREYLNAHTMHIFIDETPFNCAIRPHINRLTEDLILSPDDLTVDTMRQTYLRAIPRDILNCIMFYLFQPYAHAKGSKCHITGINYYGVATGLEQRIYTDDNTREDIMLVNGEIASVSFYHDGRMLEKKIYKHNRLIHVYRNHLASSKLQHLANMSTYPFIMTRYYLDGSKIVIRYDCGLAGPPTFYMRGKLMTE